MAAKIKIKEAIERSKQNGKKVFKKDIAERLFPGVSKAAQQVNMTSLLNGTTKRIDPDWVKIICEMCDCTPNFLFDYEEKQS